MPLVKWATPSKEVFDDLKKKDFHMRVEEFSDMTIIKMLGILWSVQDDTMMYKIPSEQAVPRTKREVLSVVSLIFDPMGLVSPVVLPMKLLLQSFWKRGLSWIDPISKKEYVEVKNWLEDIQQMKELKISCWMETYSHSGLDLEVFCDASPKAYGCAIYICTAEGKRNLLLSKCRVAPVTKLTLPRLELTAAVIGVRMLEYVTKNFIPTYPIKEVKYFSDSTITLAWIYSEKNQWKPYVSNRVQEIRANSKSQQWGHVPTGRNPADLLTRPRKSEELMKSKLWWHGTSVEKMAFDCEGVQLPEEEMKIVNLLVTTKDSTMDQFIRNFSSFKRLIRVYAYMRRCLVKNFRGADLSSIELELSEEKIIQMSQTMYFREKIEAIEKKEEIEKHSLLRNFDPFLDEKGLLRLRSRLKKSSLPFDECYPILLHPNSWITKLIIRQVHLELMHGDLSETLYRTRDRFWIIRGRRTVQSSIRACVICRRMKLKRNDPMTGDPPAERVTPAVPFQNVGIDHLGPILVGTTKKNATKVYILLFTCMVTRSIHLEVSVNLSTEKFLLAFRRFAARYGFPAKVFSDNSKTFSRGSQEIQSWGELIAHDSIKTLLSDKRVLWTFIPPLSPWAGGTWERLVQSVKDKLRKVLLKKTIELEVLQTIVLEICSVLNSRPLSYVHEDVGGGRIISPEKFLTGGMPKYVINKSMSAIKRRDLLKLDKKRGTHNKRVISRNSQL